MLEYLRKWLKDYEITVHGDQVRFVNEEEKFEAEYSLRLLIEMYLCNKLEDMFLMPAIVPW